jgi:hypothetical protein
VAPSPTVLTSPHVGIGPNLLEVLAKRKCQIESLPTLCNVVNRRPNQFEG